jgi:hypothetical protein
LCAHAAPIPDDAPVIKAILDIVFQLLLINAAKVVKKKDICKKNVFFVKDKR